MKLLYVDLLQSRPLLWYLSKFTIASCFQQLTLVISIFSQLIKYQGSKLTVVRLSRTTKITMGQPNCAKWLPLGQPNLSWH